MSQRKKQTARKTTGTHRFLSSRMSVFQTIPSSPDLGELPIVDWILPVDELEVPKPRPRARRARGTEQTPLKSILKRPTRSAATSSLANTTSLPRIKSLSPNDSLDDSVLPVGPSTTAHPLPSPTPENLLKLQPMLELMLDRPISVCMRFATWLEGQNYVQDDVLLRAIERDGSHFLSLAKATITFDHALRGNVPPTVNSAISPLAEHARTLHVFADLLKTKLAEGNLSRELESAVLRDGEPLLLLALSCLEFDRAVRGLDSDSIVGS